MIRLFLMASFSLFFVFPVYAGAPDCGYVDEALVDDVYESAERVDYYNDAVVDLENACAVSDDLKDWDKAKERSERREKSYKIAKENVVSSLESAIRSMHGPLISFHGYIYADRNGESRAVRTARIRAAQKKLNAARVDVRSKMDDMNKFMASY